MRAERLPLTLSETTAAEAPLLEHGWSARLVQLFLEDWETGVWT